MEPQSMEVAGTHLPGMDLPEEMFRPVGANRAETAAVSLPGAVCRLDAWRRFSRNKAAVAGLLVILLLVGMALVGPLMTPHTPSGQSLSRTNEFFSREYWFGSDQLGRDLFSRVWHGARVSLLIGLVTALCVLVIGVLYGGIAGYLGGWVDEMMMRLVEVLYSVPFPLYVVWLMVLMGPGLRTVLIALGAVFWLPMARLVRGQVMSLKEREFVLAARAAGASPRRIIFRHLLPNSMGPILVLATLAIPDAIFTEAWLSYLGLGVAAPMTSWGVLVDDGMDAIRSYPWQLFIPAVLISLTILAFNLLGDGLRDALDPKDNLDCGVTQWRPFWKSRT